MNQPLSDPNSKCSSRLRPRDGWSGSVSSFNVDRRLSRTASSGGDGERSEELDFDQGREEWRGNGFV